MAVNVLNQEGNQMRRLVLGIAVAAASLAPNIGMADDQQIADYIKSRLTAEQQQGNLKGFNVDMRVDRGTVWFKGQVSNATQEQTILKTAQAAGQLGVVQVVAAIEVNGQAQPARQSVMAQPVRPPEPTPATPPSAFRNAGYQQQSSGQAQFQQTSSQDSMPMAAGVVSNGPPMAFASSSGAPPIASAPMSRAPVMSSAPMASGCQGPGCYGGEVYGQSYGGQPSYGAPMAAGYGGAAAPSEAPNLPGYAWPGYAAHPNYGAVSYPKQYSPSAWPYIGPFYPYPQVPLGWRKVSLEWDDGWWQLDFHDK